MYFIFFQQSTVLLLGYFINVNSYFSAELGALTVISTRGSILLTCTKTKFNYSIQMRFILRESRKYMSHKIKGLIIYKAVKSKEKTQQLLV